MIRVLRALMITAVCGVSLFCSESRMAIAQDPYWRNHWTWYNNSYRPYYHRYYNSGYRSGYYAPAPLYNNNYGPYYGQPYAPGYYYGNGVQVGPLRFGWW